MRSNTIVHIAIRNIGDSNDNGEFFEGQLKDGFLWVAAALGSKAMAKRFAIGIGRDKAGAVAAIDLKRSKGSGLAIELEDELNKLLADSIDPDKDDEFINDSQDTWRGVNQ